MPAALEAAAAAAAPKVRGQRRLAACMTEGFPLPGSLIASLFHAIGQPDRGVTFQMLLLPIQARASFDISDYTLGRNVTKLSRFSFS